MPRHLRSFVLLGVGAIFLYGSSPVHAAPVLYTINFTGGGGGDLTPYGGFTYDATKPVGYQFSKFIVYYGTIRFDLTSNVTYPYFNNPWITPHTGPHDTAVLSNSADLFSVLMSTPSDAGTWSVWYLASMNQVTVMMQLEVPDPVSELKFGAMASHVTNRSSDNGRGGFSVTSPSPEARTSSMLLIGALALFGIRQIQTLRRNQPNSQSR